MSADKTHRDPWTDPDPQPGDFDKYILEAKPEDFTYYEPGVGVIPIEGENFDDVVEWMRERRQKREREAHEAERRSA